jgi:hypothetical protein
MWSISTGSKQTDIRAISQQLDKNISSIITCQLNLLNSQLHNLHSVNIISSISVSNSHPHCNPKSRHRNLLSENIIAARSILNVFLIWASVPSNHCDLAATRLNCVIWAVPRQLLIPPGRPPHFQFSLFYYPTQQHQQ